jgi:hypothetical protein
MSIAVTNYNTPSTISRFMIKSSVYVDLQSSESFDLVYAIVLDTQVLASLENQNKIENYIAGSNCSSEG